jgi:hypothetical protein
MYFCGGILVQGVVLSAPIEIGVSMSNENSPFNIIDSGAFVFQSSGERAHDVWDLLDWCKSHREEASRHLMAGHFNLWDRIPEELAAPLGWVDSTESALKVFIEMAEGTRPSAPYLFQRERHLSFPGDPRWWHCVKTLSEYIDFLAALHSDKEAINPYAGWCDFGSRETPLVAGALLNDIKYHRLLNWLRRIGQPILAVWLRQAALSGDRLEISKVLTRDNGGSVIGMLRAFERDPQGRFLRILARWQCQRLAVPSRAYQAVTSDDWREKIRDLESKDVDGLIEIVRFGEWYEKRRAEVALRMMEAAAVPKLASVWIEADGSEDVRRILRDILIANIYGASPNPDYVKIVIDDPQVLVRYPYLLRCAFGSNEEAHGWGSRSSMLLRWEDVNPDVIYATMGYSLERDLQRTQQRRQILQSFIDRLTPYRALACLKCRCNDNRPLVFCAACVIRWGKPLGDKKGCPHCGQELQVV